MILSSAATGGTYLGRGVAVLIATAGRAIGVEGVEIVFTVIAGGFVDVGVARRIERHAYLFDLSPVPARKAASILDQRGEALVRYRIASDIAPAEIETCQRWSRSRRERHRLRTAAVMKPAFIAARPNLKTMSGR